MVSETVGRVLLSGWIVGGVVMETKKKEYEGIVEERNTIIFCGHVYEVIYIRVSPIKDK